MQLPEVIASGTGLYVQNISLVSPAVVESMGRISGKRSSAQLAQTHRLHGPRQSCGRRPFEAEVTLLQAHRDKEVGRDAQKNLRNERKRSKRAKARCLELAKDKENMELAAEGQRKEAEKLKTRLAKVQTRLEAQKKRSKALSTKVSRFPLQKKLAIQKAVRSTMQNARLKIKMRSGRVSTPARRAIRELVLHHKVSTSMAGGVLRVLTNAGLNEEVSPRTSRRIVAEVGVGNKLRVADKVCKAKGERNCRPR